MLLESQEQSAEKTVPELRESLSRHFLGTDSETGVDCYLIHDAAGFYLAQPALGREIARQCEIVQDTVWNKKNPTFQYIFGPGRLFLLAMGSRILGFMSASEFQVSPTRRAIYYSDGMFLPEIQRRRLSYLAFGSLLVSAIQHTKKENPATREFVNVVISGNISVFKFFRKFRSIAAFPISARTSPECQEIYHTLAKDFPNLDRVEDGIIRGAWLRQKDSREKVWPKTVVDELGFPLDIDYAAGDVLYRNFSISVDETAEIEIYLSERGL